jgi:hypothetical protein
MVDLIKLGGKDYPVSLGFAALREAERETKRGLSDLLGGIENASIKDTVYICHLALKHGARKEKQEFTLTEEDVADLMDEPGKSTELSDLIGEQLGKIFAPPDQVGQK